MTSKSLITIHATHTPPTSALTLRDLDQTDRRFGFAKVGYHYVIRRDGTTESGRGWEEASMHDADEDAKRAVSICLVGDKGNFEVHQLDALGFLVKKLKQGTPSLNVKVVTKALSPEEIERWT